MGNILCQYRNSENLKFYNLVFYFALILFEYTCPCIHVLTVIYSSLFQESSTNSSSSVVVVSEKETRLSWDNDDEEDKDDEDDDFMLNEDISNEDVEKLVQSITANEIDSDEVSRHSFLHIRSGTGSRNGNDDGNTSGDSDGNGSHNDNGNTIVVVMVVLTA